MTELILADKAALWQRLKARVLDSVSSPITRHVYNPGSTNSFNGTHGSRVEVSSQ
ncbi:MAG: hypothetical protein ACR2I2_21355 [Bryobacteraceae bacterium]